MEATIESKTKHDAIGKAKTLTEEELLSQAASFLPGGVLHAWKFPPDLQFVVDYGKGSRIYDVSGNEYIDYVIGSGPMILGHAHPVVVAAVQKQIELGASFYQLNSPILQLAERITKSVPCAERIRFSSTGGEATFYALRFSRAYTGRDKILKFEGGFQGANDYAMMSFSASGRTDFPYPEPDSYGIPRCLQDEVLIAPFNDLAMTTSIVSEHADQLAAIILEPVQRYIEPKPGFLQGLRDLATKYGIVLIYDELVTGFRLAPGGAQEYYGVVPDLACLGKIIGGGLPLSAICGKKQIMDACDPARRGTPGYVVHMGTLNGNPLAAAAGVATIDEMNRINGYARLHKLGKDLREGIQKILNRHPNHPAQVIGVGPLFYIAFTAQPIFDHRSGLKGDAKLRREFDMEWVRNGIFINVGGRHYISAVHTDEDIQRTLAIVEKVAWKVLRK
jgi:glutamate-1-semialdehyde 2,1-aminomutase